MYHKRGAQDYLRTIYELDLGQGVKNIEIANKLNIKKASVSEMLKKLSSHKLVKFSPYSKIFLTRKGEKIASNLYYNHKTLKTFIRRLLKYEEQEAYELAHRIEHHFPQESINQIKQIIDKKQNIHKTISLIPNYIG